MFCFFPTSLCETCCNLLKFLSVESIEWSWPQLLCSLGLFCFVLCFFPILATFWIELANLLKWVTAFWILLQFLWNVMLQTFCRFSRVVGALGNPRELGNCRQWVVRSRACSMVARSSAGRVLSIQSHTVHVRLQQLPCFGFYSVFVLFLVWVCFFDESELESIRTSLLLQSSVGFCIVDKRIAFCTLVVSTKISHGRVCCHMPNSKTVLRCLTCYLSFGGVFWVSFSSSSSFIDHIYVLQFVLHWQTYVPLFGNNYRKSMCVDPLNE